MASKKYTVEIHLIIYQKDERTLRINRRAIIDSIDESIKPNKVFAGKVMATNTSVGKFKRQPMLTFYIKDISKERLLVIVRQSKFVMSRYGIQVHRAKSEIQLSYLMDYNIVVSGDEYLESHFKIGKVIPSLDKYHELANILIKYGIHLLINYDSSTVAPVTTMRCYDIDYSSFKKINNTVQDELYRNGFFIYKMHIEYGIYDDNVYTDEDWLFKGRDYKNSIKEIDCPQRLEIPTM